VASPILVHRLLGKDLFRDPCEETPHVYSLNHAPRSWPCETRC
jgi:hypothetical protein